MHRCAVCVAGGVACAASLRWHYFPTSSACRVRCPRHCSNSVCARWDHLPRLVKQRSHRWMHQPSPPSLYPERLDSLWCHPCCLWRRLWIQQHRRRWVHCRRYHARVRLLKRPWPSKSRCLLLHCLLLVRAVLPALPCAPCDWHVAGVEVSELHAGAACWRASPLASPS